MSKKKKKRESLADAIWAVGWRDLGSGGDTIWAAEAWLGGHLCSLSLSLSLSLSFSLSPGNHFAFTAEVGVFTINV